MGGGLSLAVVAQAGVSLCSQTWPLTPNVSTAPVFTAQGLQAWAVRLTSQILFIYKEKNEFIETEGEKKERVNHLNKQLREGQRFPEVTSGTGLVSGINNRKGQS